MKNLILTVIVFFTFTNNLSATEKDPSPLSSNGYVVQISEDVDKDIESIFSTKSNKNSSESTKPLVLKLSRVTDPSTPQPGEPMPGYPNTGDKKIIDIMLNAIEGGRPVILLPSNETMSGRLGGVTILGPGGATVFFTAPEKK